MHIALAQLAESLPGMRGRGLAFGVVTGDVQSSIAEHRARDPQAPLGYLAEDEPAVLAALAGGADDATVLGAVEPKPFMAFVERLELRARVRAEARLVQESLAHAERLTALGTLVAGVGHEINNPLTEVILSVTVVRTRLLPALAAAQEIVDAAETGSTIPPDAVAALSASLEGGREAAAILEDVGNAADAIASIVRDLRAFGRPDKDEPPERIEVPELIEHAIRLSGREASRRSLVERDYAPNLPSLLLPRGRVTQVIMNVFINAIHAIAEVERPVHRVRISVRADDDFVAVAISDTGPGISPEALERIFDPFYTTKRGTLGTGLGLSISRAILRRLGGELSVESVYGEGATFVCFLPLPPPDALGDTWKRAAEPQPGARTSTMSILVVDDDERVLRSYSRVLGNSHRLMIAYDGREAIDMLESGSMPEVLLVEFDLPGADARELLSWLEAQRPDLARRTVLVTSGDDRGSREEFLESYAGTVVYKPVRAETLIGAVARAASLGSSVADYELDD